EFYEELYKEVKYRMENKMSLVPEEKYRLLWAGGLPPWHTLGIFNYFESKGAVFVMETAYRPWDQVEIPSGITDPLERIAERYWARITYRYDKARKHTRDPRVENLLELIDEYDIDGMLMHVAFSCRATTIGQIHYRNLVNEWIQIPTMFMESDIVDVRDYSEAYTKSQVDSFMEPVAVRRKNKDK
ncbi:MAG: 2-hydroxyacyl-CoA dehydratase family protein, partial [Thermodesulfobacteriota bacterium]|nr:2-hydroxyacyl-CoA dehydratase family protein [Thermodesulfobacteriota bacterium]